MSAVVEDLRATLAANIQELRNESERRAALTAAGHPAPVDYSIGGRSVSYTAWLKAKTDGIKEIIMILNGLSPYELPMRGYSP